MKTARKRSTLQIEDGYRQMVDAHLRQHEGYTKVWWVPRTRLRGAGVEKDIFGVWDGIALKDHVQLYIQITDYSNHAKHRTKILAFFQATGAELPLAQLWSWHEGKQAFRVETWVNGYREVLPGWQRIEAFSSRKEVKMG